MSKQEYIYKNGRVHYILTTKTGIEVIGRDYYLYPDIDIKENQRFFGELRIVESYSSTVPYSLFCIIPIVLFSKIR